VSADGVVQVPHGHPPQKETEKSIELALMEPGSGVEELAHHVSMLGRWELSRGRSEGVPDDRRSVVLSCFDVRP
jgi:hypothetical protein